MLIEMTTDIADNLTKTELQIINYINTNASSMAEMSIVDIAQATYSSIATVSRAIRKCNVQGFNELRYRLTQKSNHEIMNVNDIINKSLLECQRITEQISSDNIIQISKIIQRSKRTIVIARALSEYVGLEFTFKLQLLNYNVVFISDPNIIRKISKKMNADECLFIFSLHGYTPELIDAAKYASMRDVTVISCCCNDATELFRYSKYFILGYTHEHVAINDYEVVSRISLFMISRIIIDYIAIL